MSEIQTGRDLSRKVSLKRPRRWHRWMGVSIAMLIVISSITGLLLAWKKQASWLQPKEHTGVSTNIEAWANPNLLAAAANMALMDSLNVLEDELPALERLDFRPKRGMVKIIYKGDWEVQVDATTGLVYSVAKRNVDWIERLHDGSIVADWFKNVSMTLLSIGLLFMTITGMWIWWIRRSR
jgi:uncharacterized iron-regulated membrane protein